MTTRPFVPIALNVSFNLQDAYARLSPPPPAQADAASARSDKTCFQATVGRREGRGAKEGSCARPRNEKKGRMYTRGRKERENGHKRAGWDGRVIFGSRVLALRNTRCSKLKLQMRNKHIRARIYSKVNSATQVLLLTLRNYHSHENNISHLLHAKV